MRRISYLGPKGTYSEKAAEIFTKSFQEEADLFEVPSLNAVAKIVSSDKCDLGVMAYYNYLKGLVQECLDLIYENNLNIVGIQRVPVEFSLGTFPGNIDYNNIYSHHKAIAQCSDYLQQKYPGSTQIPVHSTAAGIEIVKESKSGMAIARSAKLIQDRGLQLVATDIGNKRRGKQNYTDFYIVSNEARNQEFKEGKKYLTMVAINPGVDRVGLLADMLVEMRYYGLNLSKIHSRPSLQENKFNPNGEPQMFYLEIMCHRDSEEFNRCMEALRWSLAPKGSNMEVIRVLGSYEMPL